MANTTKITIEYPDTHCYHRYSGQNTPQPVYVQLTEDGVLHAEYNSEIGNSVPAAVFEGRAYRWTLPASCSCLNAYGFSVILDAIADDCQQLHVADDSEECYDINQNISDEIDAIVSDLSPDDYIKVWQADDFYVDVRHELVDNVRKNAADALTQAIIADDTDGVEQDAMNSGECDVLENVEEFIDWIKDLATE